MFKKNEVKKKEKSSFKRYWSFLGIILATTSLVLSLVALNQHYEGSWGGFVVFLINLPFSAVILFIGHALNFNQVPLIICMGMVQWYFIGWLIEYMIKRFHSK